jgi:diguanylate cyclase (GGDEF)-like protein
MLGEQRYLLTHVEDTTSRRSVEQRDVELTLHDGLTQLAGRALLCDRLEAALRHSAGTGLPVGVLHIDLDDVARVNDVLGRQVADTVLVAVAQRLAGLVRAGDTAGRVASDAFLLIAHDVADATALAGLARRVSAALAAPLDVERARLLMTANVGAVLACPGDPVPAVLRRARAAAEVERDLHPPARVDLGELDLGRAELGEPRVTRLPDEAAPADRPH